MATSLTGVGAVWASLSLVAAILCCSGFYLPFWIQVRLKRDVSNDERKVRMNATSTRSEITKVYGNGQEMNRSSSNGERGMKTGKPLEPISPSKFMQNIPVQEDDGTIQNDVMEVNFEIANVSAQSTDYLMYQNEETQDFIPQRDIPDSDLQPQVPEPNLTDYYKAWKKFKKMNSSKKKKAKVLEIYRDENYCTEDRYTDDEDFNSWN